jgi:hypothetical protein
MSIPKAAGKFLQDNGGKPKITREEIAHQRVMTDARLGYELLTAKKRLGYRLFGPWLRAGNAKDDEGHVIGRNRAYKLMATAAGYRACEVEASKKTLAAAFMRL